MPEISLPKSWSGNSPIPRAGLSTLWVVIAVIAGLFFGREVLVPMALALLMSLVLAPVVDLLLGWHCPRALAVLIVVFLAFAAIFSMGGLMISQINQLAANLPGYQTTLKEKIANLRGATAGSGTLERASEVLQNLSHELDKPGVASGTTAQVDDTTKPPTVRPIPVEIRQPDPGTLQTLASLITPLISPLETTGIVVVFVIFILIQKQDLRNRFIRLAGSRDLQRTTLALDDAGQRLSRLFLSQLGLNAGFGLLIGIGLWIIGIPSAPLWGMLAMILRFIPYIGALVAAIFPLVLAAAVGPGWTMVLWTIALFVVVEAAEGQAIEPIVYGHTTGLSPVAVIASATFWTWLWGPIGLILAAPLTICLVVLGRHVEHLKFLDVMLGDEPALTPPELIYQRMLAGDPVEAAEQADDYLKDRPLLTYYEEILVAGLKLAQADADRGLLDDDRQARIRDAVAEIVDDLSSHNDGVDRKLPQPESESQAESPLAHIVRAEESLERSERQVPANWRSGKPVLCVPGVSHLDEAFTLIVAQSIERQGIGVRSEHWDALSMARIFSLDTEGVELVCLCYLSAVTSAKIRYAVRRLRRKAPDAFIVVTLARATDERDFENSIRDSNRVVLVSGSLADTPAKVLEIARSVGSGNAKLLVVASP
jgi:predicted PurR-regulated permease PerM